MLITLTNLTWMVDFYGKSVGKYTVRPMDTTVDGSEIRRSPPGMVLQP